MRRARGQAVVELALTLTIVVTLLLGGFYFYEALRGRLHVTLANAAVVWEASGYGAEDLTTTTATQCRPLIAANTGSLQRAMTREGLMTQVQTWSISCTSRVDPAPSCTGGVPSYFTRPIIDKKVRFTFGLAATQTTFGSTAFLKDARTWSASGLQLCGLGDPVGGGCPLEYQLITHDWHIEDMRSCLLGGCANTDYSGSVNSLYAPGQGAGAALATFVTGATPTPDPKFYVSRSNASTSYLDPTTPAGDVRRGRWETGPGPASRSDCFLGLGCGP